MTLLARRYEQHHLLLPIGHVEVDDVVHRSHSRDRLVRIDGSDDAPDGGGELVRLAARPHDEVLGELREPSPLLPNRTASGSSGLGGESNSGVPS